MVMRFWLMGAAFFVTGCGLLLGGGSRPVTSFSVDELQGEVVVSNSQFDPMTTYTGSVITLENTVFPPNTATFRLRSFVPHKGGPTFHQIYFNRTYLGEWILYAAATDDHAEPHDVVRISAIVGGCDSLGCMHTEEVGIRL